MEFSELEELYRKRQSCREFSDRALEKEVVEKICEAALLAPSARNAQPWKLVAVFGEKKAEIVHALQHLGMNKFLKNAQALVVVAEDVDESVVRVGTAVKENEFVANDLGILEAYLVLAAEAAGVGSCIIGWRQEDELRAALSLPEKTRIPVVIALGYPADGYEIRTKTRKDREKTLTILE